MRWIGQRIANASMETRPEGRVNGRMPLVTTEHVELQWRRVPKDA